jgi:hypothetical protein
VPTLTVGAPLGKLIAVQAIIQHPDN